MRKTHECLLHIINLSLNIWKKFYMIYVKIWTTVIILYYFIKNFIKSYNIVISNLNSY